MTVLLSFFVKLFSAVFDTKQPLVHQLCSHKPHVQLSNH